MLDDLSLVHMNGRLYDAHLGRFLSPDIIVQFAAFAQSYNRYSYVLNNPLSFSDPSGYFLGGLFKSIGNFFKKYWKMIAVIAIGIITAGLAAWAILPNVTSFSGAFSAMAAGVSFGAGVAIGAITGFVAGFAGGLLNGASFAGALKSGFWGGVSGAVTGAIGGWGYLDKLGQFEHLARAMAHGIAQRTLSELQGGSFGAGFLAGAGGSLGASYTPAKSFLGKLVSAAIVGGTASRLGGGKFQNGAGNGVFTYLLNHFMHAVTPERWYGDGHSAALVGSDELGWTYMSYGTKGLETATFATLDEALIALKAKGYVKFALYRTTADQDAKMLAVASEEQWQDDYDFVQTAIDNKTGWLNSSKIENCVCFVNDVASTGGVAGWTGDGSSPFRTWADNLGAADWTHTLTTERPPLKTDVPGWDFIKGPPQDVWVSSGSRP